MTRLLAFIVGALLFVGAPLALLGYVLVSYLPVLMAARRAVGAE